MAPLSCLQLHQSLPSTISGGSKDARSKLTHSFCCSCLRITNRTPPISRFQFETSRRRDALLQTAFAAFPFPALLSLPPPVAWAVDEASDFRLYSDDLNKYKIMIPQDWQVGTGENNSINSVTAFVPQEPSTSNVSVVITGLGADFTRVESFGKVDEFAESLVGGLDRSWQRPPGVAAKLIDSKASNGLYYIEYTLQKPGESCRHLISVLGVANNGWYNRLYTVTGQYLEEDTEKYGSKIVKAIASFRFI